MASVALNLLIDYRTTKDFICAGYYLLPSLLLAWFGWDSIWRELLIYKGRYR
jgi:hypothetical protein